LNVRQHGMKLPKRILAILAVNCLLFGVGLVVVELICGGWLDASNLNRLNLLKDCIRQSDVSHLYNDPNPIIRYSLDKYGLRGTHDKQGSIDILTVGRRREQKR
jgi:hypothetical protein